MKHYGLSLTDLGRLSTDEFGLMFTWGVAASQYEAEEMQKQTADTKSSMRVAGTDTGRPMPFSDG